MPTKQPISFWTYFSTLEDPRTRQCCYPLQEILLLALCAVLSGADDWVMICLWGNQKLEWLRKFLPFKNGIPSHDTLGRVFGLLDAARFEQCFIDWMRSAEGVLQGQEINIDGKTVRGSRSDLNKAIHIVSAYAGSLGLTLGQCKTAEKSNEITAIPELLDSLLLTGCTVTIDAMGCQKAIAAQIVSKNADYVLAVKDNQPTLAHCVETAFGSISTPDAALKQGLTPDAALKQGLVSHIQKIEKDHGRIETRRYTVLQNLACMDALRQDWPSLTAFIKVESTRDIKGEVSTETRYYISSRAGTAEELGGIVRRHWGIENGLHWVLDVSYREDQARTRVRNSAENFSILRRISLNLIRQDKVTKAGVKNRRLKAGSNDTYREKLISFQAFA